MGNLDRAYERWRNGVPVMPPQFYREHTDEIDPLSQGLRASRRTEKQPSGTTPRMLKTNDAAIYLGISAWKLRNLVQSGEISYIPGDGTSPWLFDKQELDHWIETRKVKL
jgi:excisionase family DNA binding protein